MANPLMINVPRVLRALSVALALGGSVSGQTPPRDARVPGAAVDAPASSLSSGVIAGRVVHADDRDRPVRRAVVALSASSVTRRTALTDDNGSYRFEGLTAGRYLLRMSKEAYVPVLHGAASARGQGLVLALTAGQEVTNLVTPLVRGCVVTGRVIDDRGAPLTNVEVVVVQRVVIEGRPAFRPILGSQAFTDDRGVYRLYGFEAGEWLVAVNPTSALQGRLATTPTADEIRRLTELALGSARGAGGRPQATEAPPTLRHARVLYPGVTDASRATPLRFGVSEEKAGIDIVVPLVTSVSVAGTVRFPDGQPPVSVGITIHGQGLEDAPTILQDAMRSANLHPEGAYLATGVEPGPRRVVARGGVVGASLWAVADIVVGDTDLTGVDLLLRPTLSLRGRVAFEASTAAPPAEFRGVSIAARAMPGNPIVSGATAQVATDGTFELRRLVPGRYQLTAVAMDQSPVNPVWTAARAQVGSINALDSPFELRADGSTPTVDVGFIDRRTDLSGRLTDQVGQPVSEYSVFVFTTNQAFWTAGSRWVRAPARPASDGHFSILGLPAGEYYLAALTRFDPQEWPTRAFLESVVPGAIRIRLAEGQPTLQDLRLR